MNIVIGNKLKILRKNKKMSQENVAEYLCISQSAYARMESGESSSWASHLLKICRIFEITPDELLKIDVNQKVVTSKGNVVQVSDKVVRQYEERIKELKKVIKDLKKERKL